MRVDETATGPPPPRTQRILFTYHDHSMKIAFLASPKPEAAHALQELTRRYGQSDLADADYVVTIGGDGTALKALHGALALPETPVFAMRVAGSVGALANRLEFAGLHQRLRNARHVSGGAFGAQPGRDPR
jgi:NAD kinase